MRKIWGMILSVLVVGIAFSRQTPEEVRQMVRQVAQKAEGGDPAAMYQLATICERGFDSIPRDSLRAMRLYEAAAEAGDLDAQNYLGFYLISNQRSSADARRGLEWLERAAMAGDRKAQSNIGFLLIGGKGVEQDYEKGAFWLERASAAGLPAASSMLGDLYRDGKGVACDTLQAAAHYYAAFDAGLADAAYKLETMLAGKWAVLPPEEQLATALHFYTRRAPDIAIPVFERIASDSVLSERIASGGIHTEFSDSNGLIRAQALALLGDAYTRACGVNYDYDRSLRYYLAAALAGNPSAAFIMAETLEIFPDAITDIQSEELEEIAPGLIKEAGSDCRDRNIVDLQDERISDPAYWRTRAAEAGVTTAEKASRALF